MPAALDREIAIFERERVNLERDHKGKFVLIHEDQIVGTYDSFQNAANEGLRRFGNTPFLVREIGREEADISVAVLYGLTQRDGVRQHGDHSHQLSD